MLVMMVFIKDMIMSIKMTMMMTLMMMMMMMMLYDDRVGWGAKAPPCLVARINFSSVTYVCRVRIPAHDDDDCDDDYIDNDDDDYDDSIHCIQ